MAELMILWLVVAVNQIRRVLRLRRPAHANHRGALTVDAVFDSLYAQTVHQIVEERRTGEFPRIVDDHFAEWDSELGVAVDLYAHEVAPIAAQLQEPSQYVEIDGERLSFDDLASFTAGWKRKPGGGFEMDQLYAGASR